MSSYIDGHTRLYALLGSPVGHSGSPKMHNYCFAKRGVNSVYVALEVTLDRLPQAMAGVKAMGFGGLNITMPCKRAVMDYLDEISPEARLMNACNVAVNQDGKWVGYNTDGAGYVQDLLAHGVDVAGKTVAVLGAGGAGTAIAVQCVLSGAKELFVFNRRSGPSFARALEMQARLAAEVPGCPVTVCDLEDTALLREKLAACDILANATRVGMAPDVDGMPIPDGSCLRPGLVVTDAIYNPRTTRLLETARAAGCQTLDGTGMLIQQGAAAFKLFTGEEMPVDEVYQLVFGA